MPSIPRRAAWLLLTTATAVHLNAMAASALTIPPQDDSLFLLFDRAITCSASGFAPCTNGDFPDNFCCASGSTCNALAANTTIVCCPAGSSCAVLAPISCDITLQDASLHPSASVKTTALNGALPKCASGCCPFGYSCSSGTCIVNSNQNASPIQTAVAKTSTTSTAAATSVATSKATTSAATTTSAAVVIPTTVSATASTFFSSLTSTTSLSGSTASATSGSTAGNASSNESAVASADDTSGKKASPASIVGGVVGGIGGLVVVGAFAWFILSKRMRKNGPKSDNGSIKETKDRKRPFFAGSNQSTASFGHIINNPIAISISSPKPQGNTTAFRTDFIRKPRSSLGSDSRPDTAASNNALLAQSATMPAYAKANPYDNYGSTYAPSAMSNPNGAPSINTPISTSPFSFTIAMPPSPTPPPLYTNKRDSIPPIRGMRPQVRQPSTEEINIGADPSLIRAGGGNYAMSPEGAEVSIGMNIDSLASSNPNPNSNPASPDTIRAIANAALAASNGNLGAPPTDPRRLTTFSSLMAAANLDQNRPFVPR